MFEVLDGLLWPEVDINARNNVVGINIVIGLQRKLKNRKVCRTI